MSTVSNLNPSCIELELRLGFDSIYMVLPELIAPVLVWSLWNSTKAQGTLMDLHGPPNGPYEANFRGPLVKKELFIRSSEF